MATYRPTSYPTSTDLVEKNRAYTETKHIPKPYIAELPQLGIETGVQAPSVFVIGCIDFRASPEQFLDLQGGEAFVTRNLGGRFPQSQEDLLFIETITQGQRLKEVVIMHHTDCGLTQLRVGDIKSAFKAEHPEAAAEIDGLRFPTYDGSSLAKHQEAIDEDLKAFKESPLIRQELKDTVKAYLYIFTLLRNAMELDMVTSMVPHPADVIAAT
ncbi:carbonic anhydrase [Xylariaceae sp. FL0255]|nr:carbonic anhydrase [Xylariaceae sp. FL0255]